MVQVCKTLCMFHVSPHHHDFICRTSTMSCNEALYWVKWKTSHRIWQRCPENTGLDWPSHIITKSTKWKYLNIFATTLFRKDAESLNATSLAVIAGTWNAFSFWILVQLSFAKVRVAEAFFSYSWSTSGFSNCFLQPRCFYICQWPTCLFCLQGSVLLLGFLRKTSQ